MEAEYGQSLIGVLTTALALAVGTIAVLLRRRPEPWVLIADEMTVPITPTPPLASAPPPCRVRDPDRALANWKRAARAARRIRRLRKIWQGLGETLKQYSHLG